MSEHRLLNDIGRTAKPRKSGITVVIDTGLGIRAATDLVETAGEHFDYAKIAWASSLITGKLDEKLAAYKAGGVQPLLGGTLFEYAYLWGKMDELLAFVKDLGVCIEVSDGVISLDRAEKLSWIEKFAAVGQVFSECGGKTSSHDLDWGKAISDELSAGAAHVVIEGREIGPVGKEIREDLIDTITNATELDNVVFESLERYQQVWMIKRFGPNVNLANIRARDLLTLESFRQGLKEHTLLSTRERFGPR